MTRLQLTALSTGQFYAGQNRPSQPFFSFNLANYTVKLLLFLLNNQDDKITTFKKYQVMFIMLENGRL